MDEQEKTEIQTAQPVGADAPHKVAWYKNKKWLLIGAIVALLVAAGVAYLLTRGDPVRNTATDTPKSQEKKAAPEAKSGPVFCVKVGLYSLQCEELGTGQVRKYNLPETLGEISSFSSSPDGSRYFISAWQDSDTGAFKEVVSVFDSKLKRIATLPEPSGDFTSYRVEWLDNNNLVYLTSGYDLNNKSTIKVFDIKAGKESVLVELQGDIERIMPEGNPRYIYGIQAQNNNNSVARKLVVIDVQEKRIVDVKNGALPTSKDAIAYDRTTSKFYLNVLRQAEQKFNIDMYEVNSVATQPTLSPTGQVKDVYAQGSYAYTVVSTPKGIFATEDMLEWKAPLRLYADDGTSTDLSLAVGYYGSSIALSLPSFPEFDRAKTDTVVSADLFKPAKGTPEKITAFVEGLVKKAEGCDAGEYASYIVRTHDQDKQFSLSKAGCGNSMGTFYYKASGDSYVQFASSGSHGFDCAERDTMGISAVVLPDCRQPGEGI